MNSRELVRDALLRKMEGAVHGVATNRWREGLNLSENQDVEVVVSIGETVLLGEGGIRDKHPLREFECTMAKGLNARYRRELGLPPNESIVVRVAIVELPDTPPVLADIVGTTPEPETPVCGNPFKSKKCASYVETGEEITEDEWEELLGYFSHDTPASKRYRRLLEWLQKNKNTPVTWATLRDDYQVRPNNFHGLLRVRGIHHRFRLARVKDGSETPKGGILRSREERDRERYRLVKVQAV